MLRLLSALLSSALQKMAAGWVGGRVPARSGGSSSRKAAAGGREAAAAVAEVLVSGSAIGGPVVPSAAVLAALERFPQTAWQLPPDLLCCATTRGELLHALHAVAGLAAAADIAAVRAAALAVLGRMLAAQPGVLSSGGSATEHALAAPQVRSLMLGDPAIVADILQAALGCATDMAPAAAQQAQQLLLASSAGLAAALAVAPTHTTSWPFSSLSYLLLAEQPPGLPLPAQPPALPPAAAVAARARDAAFALALQPQSVAFRPAQLSKLLDHLTQAGPTAVVVGAAGRTSAQLQVKASCKHGCFS